MLFFTFIKGGVTPLTGPPNLNGFFFIEGFPKAIKSWTCCSETWDCVGLLKENPGVISWITHSWQFSEFYVLPFERILTGVKLLPL